MINNLLDKPLPRRAYEFADIAHRAIGQVRKYTGAPYIQHCWRVANLVSQTALCTDEMIAAAYLHDVLEDTKITPRYLATHFPETVVSMVLNLTDVSKAGDGNRDVRKALDRAHTAAASPQAKTIKLADLIDNARDIEVNDPAFAKVFMREKHKLLPVLTEGDAELHRIAKNIVATYFRRVYGHMDEIE